MDTEETYTTFDGVHRLASGPLAVAGLAAKRAFDSGAPGPILIFSDRTGRSRDVDMGGSDEALLARLTPPARTRGRPKLGVIAREVTLLPRHWEWLATQPGGASVALRKLVETARRDSSGKDGQRQAQERAYHFMSGIAGDLPGFEEATRALFAHDVARFDELITAWPPDIKAHARKLAFA